jgi:putative intracellular protease/amidase
MKQPLSKISRSALLCITALIPALSLAADVPPGSIEPMGQKFAEPKPEKTLRVLLVGSGSSHDFPKYFLGADAETLKAAGGIDVAATPNLDEALALLPQADVLVFSGNHNQYGTAGFQKALNDFADNHKGVVLVHAATWSHPWAGYNQRFTAGATSGHGKGEITVTLKNAVHPVMKGVPATFKIFDENYHHKFIQDAQVDLLAENSPDGDKGAHPSVWVVKDPKTRVVCMTLGHADEAHSNPAYKAILINAVNWAGNR